MNLNLKKRISSSNGNIERTPPSSNVASMENVTEKQAIKGAVENGLPPVYL